MIDFIFCQLVILYYCLRCYIWTRKESDSISKYKILIPNDNGNLADCGTTIHNLVL